MITKQHTVQLVKSERLYELVVVQAEVRPNLIPRKNLIEGYAADWVCI